MEEDDEIRLCRLCGNNARMVIDVFGDEGVKRFLAYKIQTKLNILIDETEPLPKAICVQCLGKLEFVCDFQEECLRTQQLLRDQYNLPSLSDLIEPNDGLSHFACLQCSGALEFFCDFYTVCHKTQDLFESTAEVNDENEAPSSTVDRDLESDKENVLPPVPQEQRENMPKPQETQILEENENLVTSQGVEVLTDPSTAKLCNLTAVNDERIGNFLLVSTATTLNHDPLNLDVMGNSASDPKNCGSNDVLDTGNHDSETPKNSNRRSRSTRSEKKNKKTPKSSKNGTKSKRSDKQSEKTIDKYFSTQAQSDKNESNEENVNPNPTYIDNATNSKDVESETVIQEGSIPEADEPSTIMPLKTEQLSNNLKFDSAEMAHQEIVQAKDLVWTSNDSEMFEPQRPVSMNTNQSKNASPAPGDEAETTVTENPQTAVINSSIDLGYCIEKLIVLEVQIPTKEAVNKTFPEIRRKRSISSSSSERRMSEGKYAKISALMTDDQKKDIENHYTTDMSLVDQKKVDENVLTLDKCKYKCRICETIYPRLDKCQVHIWRHLEMKPYLCRLCDFSTLTVSNIRCHIRKSHLKIKPFECHLCQKRYNSSTLLEEHLNIHTGSRPYHCELCDFASTSKQVLVHHALIHKLKKDVFCDICGKAFYSKGRMRAHKISHNKEKAFKCSLCSTYVLHQEALEKHYLNVHTKDYVCKICNKAYKSRKALHNHETVHSDAKFECPMCPNVYKSTHILREHILKHQGIRQYKCNACEKSFAQQSHLAAHMAVHSNITYNCPGCGKGFNRHDNMKVHTKRCDLFSANPELESLLPKRKISHSRNDTAKVATRKEESDPLVLHPSCKVRSSSRRTKHSKPETDDSGSPDENDSFFEKELSSEQF